MRDGSHNWRVGERVRGAAAHSEHFQLIDCLQHTLPDALMQQTRRDLAIRWKESQRGRKRAPRNPRRAKCKSFQIRGRRITTTTTPTSDSRRHHIGDINNPHKSKMPARRPMHGTRN